MRQSHCAFRIIFLGILFILAATPVSAEVTILEITSDAVAYAQPDLSSSPLEIVKSGTRVASSGKVSNFFEITLPSGAKGYILDKKANPYTPPAPAVVAPPPKADPVAPAPAPRETSTSSAETGVTQARTEKTWRELEAEKSAVTDRAAPAPAPKETTTTSGETDAAQSEKEKSWRELETEKPTAPAKAAQTKAPSGYTLGLILEQQLFSLGGSLTQKIEITDGGDSVSGSGSTKMNASQSPEIGLQAGYTFDKIYFLAQLNITKSRYKGNISWDFEGEEIDEDYDISFARMGFLGGFFFTEEQGRPFLEWSIGLGSAALKMKNDEESNYKTAGVMDLGMGAGYDYYLENGFGIAGGGRLQYIGTAYSFGYSDDSGSAYDRRKVTFSLTPLSAFFRVYYIF
jgi:hypothetical protein